MIREYVTYINAAEKWDEAYEMLIKYKGGPKFILINYRNIDMVRGMLVRLVGFSTW